MCTNMAVVAFVIWVPQDWRSRDWKPSIQCPRKFWTFITLKCFINGHKTWWLFSKLIWEYFDVIGFSKYNMALPQRKQLWRYNMPSKCHCHKFLFRLPGSGTQNKSRPLNRVQTNLHTTDLWNALQSFVATPLVFFSAKYARSTKPTDAMYVWLENVNSGGFEVCIREFLPFDGKHQDTIVVSEKS